MVHRLPGPEQRHCEGCLPLIGECLDALSGTQFISTLDLASGYWQIAIDPADRHKTAFITKHGLFEHTRMGFGLCNAPVSFQRAMELVLQGLTWKEVLAYLDDVIILGQSFCQHLDALREVLRRFKRHGLKLKPRKCTLFQTEVTFLGKWISREGVALNPEYIKAIGDWKRPGTVTEVEAFLGFVNYHREHIHRYAELAAPLYQLTGTKARATQFVWKECHQQAFEQLKRAMITAPVLAFPSAEGFFTLDTDASDVAIGAELLQVQDGIERPVAYGSYVLTPEQRRYCTTRKELLAVVRFTRQFRHYLLGRKFNLRTDHSSLTWLVGFKQIEGQLARWLEELSQYDMQVLHRPGVKHADANGLSRIPDELPYCHCYTAGQDPGNLPCKGCEYCQRVHSQWNRFEVDVDDVVPLAICTRRPGDKSTSSLATGQTGSHAGTFVSADRPCPDQVVGSIRRIDRGEPTSPEDAGSLATGQTGSRAGTIPPADRPCPDQRAESIQRINEGLRWMPGLTQEELREAQLQDPELSRLIGWLEDEREPSQQELSLCSPGVKHFWLCRSQLQLKRGVLYYTWENADANQLLLMVPREMVQLALQLAHDSPGLGHFSHG